MYTVRTLSGVWGVSGVQGPRLGYGRGGGHKEEVLGDVQVLDGTYGTGNLSFRRIVLVCLDESPSVKTKS